MQNLNVFIVDDDKDFAESVADVLELKGHNVTFASTGEEAIEKMRQHDFDITFMDVKLPGKNGVESFLDIRRLKPSAKVIMMTGYSVEQLLDEAVDNGAWGILHKPLDMKSVLKQLEKIKPHGVMIVDDDSDFVDSIKELLAEHGYDVFVALDGSEALERIDSDKIDVLILDLRMPMLNGLEVYMKLKELNKVVPTIIVTAYAKEEAEQLNMFRKLTITGIPTKPFDPEDLLASVQSLSAMTKADK